MLIYMDVQLSEIINKIKQDGIAEAKKTAEDIVNKAKKDANEIINKAEKQAKDLEQRTIKDIQTKEESSKAILKQAGKNLVLSVQQELENLFTKVLEKKVDSMLDDADIIKSAIIELFKRINLETDAQIQLNQKMVKQLQDSLLKQLNSEQEIEIKPLTKSDNGFKLALNNGHLSYDFTAKEIASILAELLNDELAALIKD